MTDERWPELRYDAWKDTYATLHMWTEVVGKVALALAPPLNHSWGVAFQITARGLMTRTLAHGARSFTIEFDFIDHRLVIRVSDGTMRTLVLAPQSVADFYGAVMDVLREMKLPVKIWPMPSEIPSPIRFDEDTVHHAYDPDYANRVWRILVQVERVLNVSRCPFVGKCSPVHFFWGGSMSPSRVFPDGSLRRARGPRSCATRTRTKSSVMDSGPAAVQCSSRRFMRTRCRSRAG